MASGLPKLPAEYTGTVRYPLNDLLTLARSIFKSLEEQLRETADEEVEKEAADSGLSDILQCISAVNGSRLKGKVGENNTGTKLDTNILRHSAEEALFRLNGEVGWDIEAAISLRKDTREDPPTDDPDWQREDALLDLLRFIVKKENYGLFKPTDHVPASKSRMDSNSQSTSPGNPSDQTFAFTGSLLYPIQALISFARFIVRDLERDKKAVYNALEDKNGEEEGDLSSLLLAISLCRISIDGPEWKVETLRRLPRTYWDETTERFFNDPRGSEKELFKLNWQSEYVIQEAIKYRKEKRGDAVSSDPDWRNEDALLDLLLFVTMDAHEGMFEPVFDDSLY